MVMEAGLPQPRDVCMFKAFAPNKDINGGSKDPFTGARYCSRKRSDCSKGDNWSVVSNCSSFSPSAISVRASSLTDGAARARFLDKDRSLSFQMKKKCL
jgi:hypothetical protein